MKLENVEVSSQGSLVLQLHKSKSKSKSGEGGYTNSRDPVWALQVGRALGISCSPVTLKHTSGPLVDLPSLFAHLSSSQEHLGMPEG